MIASDVTASRHQGDPESLAAHRASAVHAEADRDEILKLLATLPDAFVGGILALYLAGETWNVSSLVGLIGLFGIAVQNGLVLVTQTRALVDAGKPFDAALREACIGRVRPKVMTAATAILASGGIGPPPIVVVPDRPFLFLVYDEPTGQILFVGRLVDPRSN